MTSTHGQMFRVTTFGESHGTALGAVVEGVPGNMPLDLALVQQWLDRRRPGTSNLTSPRSESDQIECLSGIENGRTLGSPIAIMVKNQNVRREDYKDLGQVFRPGHADFTMAQKYGIISQSGGGRASARETIGRVIGGAIAWQLLRTYLPDFDVIAWVHATKDIALPSDFIYRGSREEIELSTIRCPDPDESMKMEQVILDAKNRGDSVGGIIKCRITGCPAGIGEPVFDKLEADFAKAMLSLPASKGFEIGDGFAATRMFGSEHNDSFTTKDQRITTKTNHAGGILGGISTGNEITLAVAFKPVSTIFQTQETIDRLGNEIKFKPERGRHDPCVLPRAVPMVEAMAAMVVADHFLRQKALSPFIER